jgi:hypothetical protein
MRCEKCGGTGAYINADTGMLGLCDECVGGCASCCEGKTVQDCDPGYWPRIYPVPAGLHTEAVDETGRIGSRDHGPEAGGG